MSPLDRDREQRAPPRDISDNFRVNILTPKIRKKKCGRRRKGSARPRAGSSQAIICELECGLFAYALALVLLHFNLKAGLGENQQPSKSTIH